MSDIQYSAICQSCGWKRKNNDIVRRWDGLLVCKDTCYEPRNILDFYKPRNDAHRLPWTSPESTDTVVGNAGYALNCLGSQNATVAVPSASNIVTGYPITVEAMVLMPTGAITSTRNIYRRLGGGVLFRVEATDCLSLYFFNTNLGGGVQAITTASWLPAAARGRWARLAVVITNAAICDFYIYYRDSTGAVQTKALSSSTNVFGGLGHTGALIIGNTTGSTEPAPGPIDDIRVWSTARTLAQIAANWDVVVPTTSTGLVSNWRFDDLTTTPLASTTTDSIISQSATLNGAQPYPHLMGQGT